MLSAIWNDIRYSARTLARNPGVTALAVATIALGVGVNAGIFTTVNGLLFRDLPAPDAHELVSVQQSIDSLTVQSRDGGTVRLSNVRRPFSTAQYRSMREQTTTLSGIFGASDPTRTILGGESPRTIVGMIVTCEYFDVLRQPPAMGRALRAEDCVSGTGPVVVLTHALWASAFASDPGIVGRVIELNRQLFTVVGVAQEGTHDSFGIYRAQYFAPISTEPLLLPSERSFDDDARGWLSIVGRRAASIEQVRAELGVFAAQLDAVEPDRRTTMLVERAKASGFFRERFATIAAVLTVPFAAVLLIACANVANLLLARATGRNREIAIRFSLGASRARVIRQLLTESLFISIAGGVLGSVLAVWAFQALTAVAIPALTLPGLPPFFIDATPDFRVVAVMAAVMVGTGVLVGLAPALQVSKPDLHAAIKQGSQATGSARGGRLQGALIGLQVATTMVLMVAAGLLLRGLTNTHTVNPGFEARDVAVVSYDLLGGGYAPAEVAPFQRRLLEEVRGLPAVEAAAQVITEPLNPDGESAGIRLPAQDRAQSRGAGTNAVTADYFDVVGIPIVRGRAFEDAEMAGGASVAIVTESTARNLWPDQDPIGQPLVVAFFQGDFTVQIVGVARDAQVAVMGQVEPYYVYLPSSPQVAQLLRLVVKSRTDFASTAAAIRAAVGRLDPGLAVHVSPLDDNLGFWRTLSGTLTGLAASLGMLALTLGAVGIYGVVAYFVARRTREIAIRVALGARPGNVLTMILKRTMRPVAIGAVVGLAGAVAVSRLLSSVLYGVSPYDPFGIGAAALFVFAVAFAAGFLPGRTATRRQPLAALHYE